MKGQEWYQADDIAEEYEDRRFSLGGRMIDRREKRAVLEGLGPVEGKDILEIACGTGRFTVMLAERGGDIVGLDISDPMLQQGREKARAAGVADHVTFVRGDAGSLPFDDDHFDTVFAMRFFHLADTPATFLSEIRRVAEKTVFFDTFNRFSARSIYNWALPMGSRLYSRWEVGRLLNEADLELVGERHDFVFPYGFYRNIPRRTAKAFRGLDNAIRRLPGGDRVTSVSFWTCRV